LSKYLCKRAVNKGCVVVSRTGNGEQYPYDCPFKQQYPNSRVYECTKHGNWWIEEEMCVPVRKS
jgi:hypothetical protein